MSWQLSIVVGVASISALFLAVSRCFDKAQEHLKTLFLSLSLFTIISLARVIGIIAENETTSTYLANLSRIANPLFYTALTVIGIWIMVIVIKFLLISINYLKDMAKGVKRVTNAGY